MKGFKNRTTSSTKRDVYDNVVQFSDYTTPDSSNRATGSYGDIEKITKTMMMLMYGPLALLAVRAMFKNLR